MILFENFNTSNQTSPRFEKHENFVIDLKPPGCSIVQMLDYADRCNFVRETEECHEDVLILDYTDIFYCMISPQNGFQEFLGTLVLMLMCAYLFSFVGTTTDKFFCPPLKIITKEFGISENLAGTTLLAFGNSAPDLISSLVGITEEVGTMYSDLMGSAMFITACIAGCVIAMRPFQIEPTGFARDICFHILAIVFIDYAIKSDRYVTIAESIVIVSIYLCYLTIIIADQIILMKTLKNLTKQLEGQISVTDAQSKRLEVLQEEAGIKIVIKPRLGITGNISTKTEYSDAPRNEKLFSQFFTSLMPVDLNEWRESGICGKICIIFQLPINMILIIMVPAVDLDLENKGWSKLLNCLQIIIMPFVLTALIGDTDTEFGFFLPIFTLFFTVPLSILIFLITRTDRPPAFHLFYAFFSIVGSIVLVRIYARELINIITVLGLLLYCSQSFLGSTVIAWGDCVGDLIATIELAKQGYQKMGLASCVAGPLFYLSLGLGITYLYKALIDEEHVFEATQGSMGENCTVFMLANLTGLLLAGVTTDFKLRRSIGVHMLITYALFCFYSFLGEIEFIHPFGTDHSEDYGIAYL